MNLSQPTLKVLFVAIDKYPQKKDCLYGCNNDIQAFQAFLEKAVDVNYNLDVVCLTDEQATYDNLTTTFLQHFQDLKANDVALFYYSGHGAQVPAPEPFWHYSPNKKHESLFLYDSKKGKNLIDKELAWLIWKVTQNKKVHFTAILDACHSGSGARFKGVNVRRVEAKKASRAWTTYLGATDYIQEGGKVIVPVGNHLLLSACESSETAKEGRIGGKCRGAFSYSLLKALQKSNRRLSVTELMFSVQATVNNLSFEQHPQLESGGKANIHQLFLSNLLTEKPLWSLVNFDKKLGWIVHAGTIHGIPLPEESNTTTTKWLVYPIDASLEVMKNHEEALTTLTAVQVFATCTTIKSDTKLNTSLQYKAILSEIMIPTLKVAIAPNSDQELKEIIENEVAEYPSLFLTFVAPTVADYLILGKQEQIYVLRNENVIPFFRPIDDYTKASIYQLFSNLETLSKWQQVKALSNPYTNIKNQDVKIECYEVLEATPNYLNALREKAVKDILTKGVELKYQMSSEGWKKPMFRLKIHNTSSNGKDLWVNALFLSADGGIDNSLLFNHKLEYGQATSLIDSEDNSSVILLEVEEAWQSWGIYTLMERLKIIVSTGTLDTNHFRQKGLPLKQKDIRSDFLEKGRARKQKALRIDTTDWTTFDIALKIILPVK